MKAPARIILFAANIDLETPLIAAIEAAGYQVVPHGDPNLADEVFRRERPDLLVAVPRSFADAGVARRLADVARNLKLASLAVVDDDDSALEQAQGYDDWVSAPGGGDKLVRRVAWLIGRDVENSLPAIDPRFLALMVHDLRTPLNVIGLTIRAIGQSASPDNPDFEEDLTFLQENAKQIEKMLAQLGDYCRLLESERNTSSVEFETRRFLADLLEEKQAKRDSEFKGVRLEIAPDSPAEVALDPAKARLAIIHALANGVAAAGDAPVKLRSRGPAGSWTIEVIVEKAPPPTTVAVQLQSHVFERLLGSAAERRGLDLALTARVAELFGGSARLDVEPGVRSVLALEWPIRLGKVADPI